MRVLCLYLPQWPAQRARASGSVEPGRPILVFAPVRNRKRVVARCPLAAKRGVAVGMPLAEAEAVLDDFRPVSAALDPAADRSELERLAAGCGRFGPVAGVEEAERPCSILVDCTGCESFFNGENGLAGAAVAFVASQGYAARAGLAETVGLAWAASRAWGKGRVTVVPAGGVGRWLPPRPVELLRLPPAALSKLAGLGLRTVRDVFGLPRAELPSRFGPDLLRRLDQAIGRLPEPIEPVRPAVPPSAEWSGDAPLADRRLIGHVLARLVRRLLARLAPWEGITGLTCRFDGECEATVRPASPSRSAERLTELVRLALDRSPPPREVSRVVVSAETARLPSPGRMSLFEAERTDAEKERAFRRLVERLSGRLGTEAVARPFPTGNPLPERSVRLRAALNPAKDDRETPDELLAAASRPVILFAKPEPVEVVSTVPDGPPFRLTRGGGTATLTRAIGPERIEAGWADGLEARRDYWRAETAGGDRLWLFRCRRSGRWFLHGLFA